MRVYTLSTHTHYATALFDVCRYIQSITKKQVDVVNFNKDLYFEVPHKRAAYDLNVQEVQIPKIKDTGLMPHDNDEYVCLEDFLFFVDKLILAKRPDFFLFLDDGGVLEYNILRLFNYHNIPVLLWLHGPPDVYSGEEHIYTHYEKINDNVTAKNIISHKFNGIGLNRHYYICANSPFDKATLELSGVPSHLIQVTGNPKLDGLCNEWKNTKIEWKQIPELPKILIVSTGYSIWNMSEPAHNFYEQICDVVLQVNGKYAFFLRLKPEETLDSIPESLRKKILDLGISIVDNNSCFAESCSDYDIIAGDYSSCLVEAFFLRKPVVVIHNAKFVSTYLILRLSPLIISNSQNSDAVFSLALTEEYLLYQDQKLVENEHVNFYSFDGLAHARIGDFALKVCNNEFNSFEREIVKNYREINYDTPYTCKNTSYIKVFLKMLMPPFVFLLYKKIKRFFYV